MKNFFAEQKQAIYRYLTDYIRDKREDLSRVHTMGADSGDRILDFTEKGKMLRGGLTVLAYLLTRADPYEDAVPREVYAVGAVMELFQSGFLIHDDIMDRDEKRRGIQSIFAQYGRMAAEAGIDDSYHTGESLGICAGDIAFFMAFEILAGLGTDAGNRLTGLCAREISYVGVAQMMDVYWGQTPAAVKEADIIALYRYKTGRYTFSLPLICGAVLAGASEVQSDALEKIGELLGVVFQLKDDELGLFGDEQQLGKPIGSDLKEGKKTPFFIRLMDRASADQREKLSGLIGNEKISADDVKYVRGLVESSGIREEIGRLCEEYAEQSRSTIAGIDDFDPRYRDILLQLVDYSLNRRK
ncbi:MAG: polyprenyl synthetase family protein [Spirochaetota bacterium]|nr:polyprenyl synthetase family protein [Spirochaetota bacterium]